jgi:aspartyl/asparaginyl beta-hydroxylase (cupin superfamily)
MQSINENELVQAGMKALQAGEAAKARSKFETVIRAGKSSINAWTGLAMACEQLSDAPATLRAVDQILKLDPHNIRALLMKGDYYNQHADLRAAAAHYGMAIRLVNDTGTIPPGLAAKVEKARAMQTSYANAFVQHLEFSLKAAGYNPKSSSPRFTLSLEMMQGKKQRQPEQRQYPQMPHVHYFPGLPHIQFYPREQFPWMDRVEAATEDICQELLAILENDNEFEPYIQSNSNRPVKSKTDLMDSKDWSSCYLWKNGSPVPEIIERCPKTVSALANTPITRIKGRAPSILFSRLEPGTKIMPHTGLINSRLICHLPLIVPQGCGLRVGDDSREVVKGKGWVFDDSINHEAWNSSDKTRVILLFEIWRPELTEEECKLVAALLEAVDSFGVA